jgi:hypothetical protein
MAGLGKTATLGKQLGNVRPGSVKMPAKLGFRAGSWAGLSHFPQADPAYRMRGAIFDCTVA